MKRIYSWPDRLLVYHLRNLLEQAGIPSQVRNDILGGAAGDLPMLDTWPELWLSNDADEPRARRLIEEQLHAPAGPRGLWICPRCGESVEDQFTLCWNCGAPRPD